MPRIRTILITCAVLLPIGGCGLLVFEALNPNMRGPRGYYVQKEDPTVYIEFFEKPMARSNVVKEFGDADYEFSAFDGEINLSGPKSAPKAKQRYYEIVGEGAEIRVQDLSDEPLGEKRIFPVTHYTKTKRPIQPPQRNAGSRPSSGDTSASETPSSLGPRG